MFREFALGDYAACIVIASDTGRELYRLGSIKARLSK